MTQTTEVTQGIPAPDPASFRADWLAWREAAEQRRRDPHGFLAYRAVHFLDDRPRSVAGVPGRWSTGPAGPVVELGTDETLLVDGREITGRHAFGPVAEREFRRVATLAPQVPGVDVVLELSRRGGNDLLRPLDPAHPLRADYLETPAYEPDPAWVLDARFERYSVPLAREIEAAVDGIVHVHDAVGEVVFTVDGEEHRLLVLGRDGLDDLGIVLFRDATSGVTTYAASRSLQLPLPAPGSRDAAEQVATLTLDLNRAGNLQCAYTDHAPCPLAPARNHLPFAVEAGERIPVFRSGSRDAANAAARAAGPEQAR